MRILWIPHTGWHIPQRAHLFCRALAERHEVHVTDWVADFSSLREYFSKRYLRNFTYRCYSDGRVTIHAIPRISPALFIPALRRLNTVVFVRYVQQIISKHKIDVMVGTFVLPPTRAPRLVFDLFDENVAAWRLNKLALGYADEIEQVERRYLREADAVVVASSVLADKARANGFPAPLYVIPNGVDLRRFDGADGTRVKQSLGVRGQLVGSVANHDRPAELDKILNAAKELSNLPITFLIAGRGTAVPVAQKRAQRNGLTNIIFLGYISPEEVADTISALNVGLCPYLKSPMDDARSPMRLLMYAAAGIPTVCTDLDEVRRMQFPNVVLVDDSAQSLAEGIRRALELPRIRPPQIEEYDIRRLVAQYEVVLSG